MKLIIILSLLLSFNAALAAEVSGPEVVPTRTCLFKCPDGANRGIEVPINYTCESYLSNMNNQDIAKWCANNTAHSGSRTRHCTYHCANGFTRSYTVVEPNTCEENKPDTPESIALMCNDFTSLNSLNFNPADKLPLIQDNLVQLKELLAGKQEINELEQDGVEYRIEAAKTDLKEVALFLTESQNSMENAINHLDESGTATWCKPCIRELYGYTNQEGDTYLHSNQERINSALELTERLISKANKN